MANTLPFKNQSNQSYQEHQQEKYLPEILLIYAQAFSFPQKDFYEEINSGKLDREFKELWENANLPQLDSSEPWMERVPPYEEWIRIYNEAFLGAKKPLAPPIESLYKPWTVDESFQVPFKHQKGYLMGDSAQHILHITKTLGWEIPVEYQMMPDHLSILLEILARFLANGWWSEGKQFIQDHLDWLPDWCKELEELPVETEVYRKLAQDLEYLLAIIAKH
ncbi:MAG: molecular chaperone TorD family protein [Desulfitobacterium sp.]|nr:molecular chaperone TorD family protein [Desulfitobacterium sp.]